MTNILEVKDLTKKYGSKTALKGISFAVPKGKIVGVLGPNGSGKTTLIKAVMGLLSGYEGGVTINGLPPGPEANKLISYLPDETHIPDWFKVSQAIRFFSDFYEDFDRAGAENMLAGMGVDRGVKIKTLSRGTIEKVQLALVMSRRAKLYILDEPIGAVDPASREYIVEAIIRNFPEESSILLTTHIIADIEPILDRVLFLRDGTVALDDGADAIREERGTSLDQLFREVFRNVH